MNRANQARLKKEEIHDRARGTHHHAARYSALAGAILGISSGVIMLSMKFTGNVIGSNAPSSMIGVGVLLMGLLAGFSFLNLQKIKI
jgi:uncharacterized membrane protein